MSVRRRAALRVRGFVVAAAFLFPALAHAQGGEQNCNAVQHEETDYVVCRFDPAKDQIRLFLNDGTGEPYGHFGKVNAALGAKGERLAFAMNAGMYHDNRAPVGLYIEDYQETATLKTSDGPGNFHMKPNGVFWINEAGAHVQSSTDYDARPEPGLLDTNPKYATQSGPMLVIGNEIHPRFLPDSDSLKRRNGVGVTETGEVVFALADTPVRFYDFAKFFRDELKTPNALYLDGTISRLYAPALNRNDPGVAMGPIVGVVVVND